MRKSALSLLLVLTLLLPLVGCAAGNSASAALSASSEQSLSFASQALSQAAEVPESAASEPTTAASAPSEQASSEPVSSEPAQEAPPAASTPSADTSGTVEMAASPLIPGDLVGKVTVDIQIGCGVNLMLGTGDTRTLLDGFAWGQFLPEEPEKDLTQLLGRPDIYYLSVENTASLEGGPGNGQTLYVFEQEPQVMLARREDGAITYSYYTAPDNCYGYIYEMARRVLARYNNLDMPMAYYLTGRHYYEDGRVISAAPAIEYHRGMLQRKDFGNTAALYRQQAGSAKPDPAIGLTRDQIEQLYAGFTWDKFIPAHPDRALWPVDEAGKDAYVVEGAAQDGRTTRLYVFEDARQCVFVDGAGEVWYYDVPRLKCYDYLAEMRAIFDGENLAR